MYGGRNKTAHLASVVSCPKSMVVIYFILKNHQSNTTGHLPFKCSCRQSNLSASWMSSLQIGGSHRGLMKAIKGECFFWKVLTTTQQSWNVQSKTTTVYSIVSGTAIIARKTTEMSAVWWKFGHRASSAAALEEPNNEDSGRWSFNCSKCRHRKHRNLWSCNFACFQRTGRIWHHLTPFWNKRTNLQKKHMRCIVLVFICFEICPLGVKLLRNQRSRRHQSGAPEVKTFRKRYKKTKDNYQFDIPSLWNCTFRPILVTCLCGSSAETWQQIDVDIDIWWITSQNGGGS